MATSRRTIESSIVSCKNCRMSFRVENLVPYTTAVKQTFCSACGSEANVDHVDGDDDSWLLMAAAFGLPKQPMSGQLIKGLYEIWSPEEFPFFPDFVKSAIDDYMSEQESS